MAMEICLLFMLEKGEMMQTNLWKTLIRIWARQMFSFYSKIPQQGFTCCL